METVNGIVESYSKLLVLQYRQKPKAVATIQTMARNALMPTGGLGLTDNDGNLLTNNAGIPLETGDYVSGLLPLQLNQAFNLDNAVGQQLDILGKYIGGKRQGYNFSQAMNLDDDQYRQFLKILVGRNKLRFDIKSIQEFIAQFFKDVLQVFAYGNMWIGYSYLVPVGSNLVAEFFIKAGQLPDPLCVGLKPLVPVAPKGNKFFGFTTTGSPAPATTLGFGISDAPAEGWFLNTQDVIHY